MFFLTMLLIGVTTSNIAYAHDPLFLTSQQLTPQEGPYLPDGTISFALYGEFTEAGETRGFQANFQEGDYFQLELLIPARTPEEDLPDNQLPYLQIVRPDGSEETLYPNIRSRFDEPFTNTSYYILIKEQATAAEGVYDITIISRQAARFTVAVGIQERFGTPVERAGDRPSAFDETRERLGEWYSEPTTSEEPSTPEAKDEPQEKQQLDEPDQSIPEQSIGPEPQQDNRNTETQTQSEEPEQSKQPNRAIWLVVLIAVASIPVTLVIRRIRRLTTSD